MPLSLIILQLQTAALCKYHPLMLLRRSSRSCFSLAQENTSSGNMTQLSRPTETLLSFKSLRHCLVLANNGLPTRYVPFKRRQGSEVYFRSKTGVSKHASGTIIIRIHSIRRVIERCYHCVLVGDSEKRQRAQSIPAC